MANTLPCRDAWRLLPVLFLVCLLPPLAAQGADDKYSPAELEEIVGPIALYPDVVISSLLPASTAPTDVVQAARWIGSQSGEITEAPADANWDPAVEAMIQFPDVVLWMSENLDWMEMLGYAVAVQEDDVLQAVQDFRTKTEEAGNLQSNEQIQVVQEGDVIYVQPAQPTVVYVPTYDPYAVIRPGYAWGPSAWGVGFAMGAVGAWAWHSIRWGHHGRFTIQPHPHHNFTNNGKINVNIGSGNRWSASNRPAKRPSQLPAKSRPRPPQKRPGTGGRPGSGGVKPRPEQPISRPGGRPGDRPARPGAGDRPPRPDKPPARPGAGDRPARPDKPPTRPGAGDRPARPDKPPARPGAGDRPTTRPTQPSARPAPNRSAGDRSPVSGSTNSGRSTQNASNRGRSSTARGSAAGSQARSKPSGGASRPGGGGGRRR